MSTAKESLVRRIRALLSKTVENGATEAEAMAALVKAQEIMQAHGLDREAIEAEAFIRETYASKQATRGFYWGVEFAHAVSVFTGAYAWLPESDRNRVTYAGRESDTIFAFWLTDALDAFVTRNATAYINQTGGAKTNGRRIAKDYRQEDLFGGQAVVKRNPETDAQRAAKIRDFGLGVCARISERLMELATDETKARRDAALRKLQSEGMSFGKAHVSRRSIGDYGAFAAGQAAGNDATFSKPMSGGAGPRLIANG